jgi:tetratricopeptide (TPR) repeat protein
MRIRPVILGVLSAALLLPAIACGGGGGATHVATHSAEAQIQFGVDMAKRGLWNEALFRFEQAENIDPENYRVWNNLAVAYEATGQFEQALGAYQRALRMQPDNRELRRNYSRFVEFYQSFKPDEPVDAGVIGDGAAAGAAEAAPETEPGATAGDGCGAADRANRSGSRGDSQQKCRRRSPPEDGTVLEGGSGGTLDA